jgi:hypothetical protein
MFDQGGELKDIVIALQVTLEEIFRLYRLWKCSLDDPPPHQRSRRSRPPRRGPRRRRGLRARHGQSRRSRLPNNPQTQEVRSIMSRPDPIQYAERLYAAIRAANFSPISFLAFGSAVKDGVDLRRMPRIAAEPFLRVVGEMLDIEEEASGDVIVDADVTAATSNAPISAAALPGEHRATDAPEPPAYEGAAPPDGTEAGKR